MAEPDFQALLTALQRAGSAGGSSAAAAAAADPVDLIRAAVSTSYIKADQGRQIVDLLLNNFDKVGMCRPAGIAIRAFWAGCVGCRGLA